MNLTCKKCNLTQPIFLCIDAWSIVNGNCYCLSCSKELRIGWFEKK